MALPTQQSVALHQPLRIIPYTVLQKGQITPFVTMKNWLKKLGIFSEPKKVQFYGLSHKQSTIHYQQLFRVDYPCNP